MWDRPVVSLHGNGESVTLDNLSADWVLMQGAAGLGVSPVELSTAPLAGGGSVLQHRRFTEAEIVVPILLGRSRFMDRFEQRRTLERLCDGLVEIRIETSEGTRSRWGYYSDGLQGDYGEGEDSIDGQKLALTFLCLDQFWKGEEHSFIYKVDAPKKPFLSVATNGRENLWDGKQLTDYTQSVWDVVDDGLEKSGEDRLAGLDLDDWRVDASEGTPFTVDMSLKFLSGDGQGRARITGVSYKDGSKISEATLMETNRSGRFGCSFYPAPGADAVSVGLYVADSMGRDERVRVSRMVLWGPTDPPPPPVWVEVARNLLDVPQSQSGTAVARASNSAGSYLSPPTAVFDYSSGTKYSTQRTPLPGVTEMPSQNAMYLSADALAAPVSPGETRVFLASLYSTVAFSVELRILYLRADGSTLSTARSSTLAIPNSEWTPLEFSSVAPADAVRCRLGIYNMGGALPLSESTLFATDAWGFLTTAAPWFSGDHAPDGMRSEWLGEPNNSASVLYELQ